MGDRVSGRMGDGANRGTGEWEKGRRGERVSRRMPRRGGHDGASTQTYIYTLLILLEVREMDLVTAANDIDDHE